MLSEAQLARLGNMLAARSYKFDAEERPDIVDQLLSDLGDGNLIGPVLREAIAQSDWDAVRWTDKVQGGEENLDTTCTGVVAHWKRLGNLKLLITPTRKPPRPANFMAFLAAEKTRSAL